MEGKCQVLLNHHDINPSMSLLKALIEWTSHARDPTHADETCSRVSNVCVPIYTK